MDPQRGSSAIMIATDGTAVLAEMHLKLTMLEGGMAGASNVAARVAEIKNQIAAAVVNISTIPSLASKRKKSEHKSEE